MRWPATLWRNLARRGAVDRELDAELRATLDLLIEEKVAAGVPRDQAVRTSRIELGGIEAIKDRVRDVRAGSVVDSLWHDVRWAARLLARYPLFTLTAVLSLAVGIGATTAIFTIANGLLLRTATGIAEPDRIVDIIRLERDDGPGIAELSFPTLRDVRERTTTLEAVYGYRLQPSTVSLRIDAEAAEAAFATLATNNFFSTLGVRAAAGRLFPSGEDDRHGANPIVVLGHRYWQRRFGGDPSIVGRPVFLNGVSVTVAGVVEPSFRGLSVVDTDVWVPLSMVATVIPDAGPNPLGERVMSVLQAGARLRDGVSRAQASAELARIGEALQREYPVEAMPEGPPGMSGPIVGYAWSAETATPVPYGVRMIAAGFLGLLMAVVSIVLVIACTNLAGVLLARAAARRREIAVRTAIGAGRSRLVRLLLTETVLLFALGGVTGLVLARVITLLLVSLLPAFPIPINLSTPLDGRVVAFALGLAFVAAVLSGLAPALHASRTDVVTALKDETQGPSDRLRLRSLFVVIQVACSVLLVVVAGLLVRGLDRKLAVDQGFNPRGVDVASFDLSQAGYTAVSGAQFAQQLLATVHTIPGVDSATLADHAPEPGGRSYGSVVVPGQAATDASAFFNWTLVAPGYFRTLGIPLLGGRDFTHGDRDGAERVAILGRSAAMRLFGGADPIGRHVILTTNLISRDGRPSQPPPPVRIVGVVGDLNVGGPQPLALYVPLWQRYMPQMTVLVHRVDDQTAAAELRRLITGMEPRLPVIDAKSLNEAGARPVDTQLRIAATVAASVGLIGLFLAGVGIYGVTAYAVAQRTREIGIRLSLGASRGDVVRMVLRDGMRLVAFGAMVGLLLGLGAGRLLSSSRYGLPQLDPVTLAGAVVLLTLVGLVACYVPVRRAARIRAMEALRYE